MPAWYLESFYGEDILTRTYLHKLPAQIGRDDRSTVPVQAALVSRRHAEISVENDQLTIRDLGSTNGTFVNFLRINKATRLQHGDVIHIGDTELRIIQKTDSSVQQELNDAIDPNATATSIPALSNELPYGIRELEELIAKRQIRAVFQEIVDVRGSIIGYELLSRGTHGDLPNNPFPLFQIAESIDLAVTLSELMREQGLAEAHRQQLKGKLYVNTHPSELRDPSRLINSLRDMRQLYPASEIVLEIHEEAITGVAHLHELKTALGSLGIELAFDDFGVGQSRLLELVEATPHILKFDLALIKSIHTASQDKLNLIRKLLEMAEGLNITCLAECVSSKEEYEICRKLGFTHFQGFYFGKPKSSIETKRNNVRQIYVH